MRRGSAFEVQTFCSLSGETDWRSGPLLGFSSLDVLFDAGSWADVVGESQEIVELTLKALLHASGIDPPRVHDVSDILLAERDRLPQSLPEEIKDLTAISHGLRRNYELVFYGAEYLIPSGLYKRNDAERARSGARKTVNLGSRLFSERPTRNRERHRHHEVRDAVVDPLIGALPRSDPPVIRLPLRD